MPVYRNDKSRELTASETLSGLMFGINGLIPKLKGKSARGTAKKAKELLILTRNLLSEGIAQGTEDRT
jgi:hypothetical protein